MKKNAVSTLMKVAAALATRRPLHAIDELCDNQKQVSSARLYDMVEASGDELAGYASDIRICTDAINAREADFVAFLELLSANVNEHGPRSLSAIINSKLEDLRRG